MRIRKFQQADDQLEQISRLAIEVVRGKVSIDQVPTDIRSFVERAADVFKDAVTPPQEDPLANKTFFTGWTAELLEKWKGHMFWQVFYDGKYIDNGVGNNTDEAIRYVKMIHPDLPD
jgi:hypothetical protein